MAGFGIIDTPNNVTRYLPRLTATHSIIRYLTRGNPTGAKHIKLAEVRAIKAAGKKLAFVHETWGDIAHAGSGGISKSDGERDGAYCRRILPGLGAPAGACVYFAVDVDVSAAQLRNNVIPYFRAVKNAFADGEYRTGVYGPGSICQALKTAGLCDLFWLANAKGWSGYNAFKPHADLVQRLPTKIVGGLDVDPNDAQVEDWGQFVPFADDATIFPVAAVVGDEATAVDDAPRRLAQGDDTAFDPEAVTAIFTEPEAYPEAYVPGPASIPAPVPAAAAAAAGVAVGKAAAAGASPAVAAAAGAEAAESMGMGTGRAASAAATAVAMAGQMGGFAKVKSIFRSKITWLTTALGGSGATVGVATDPEAQGLLMRLMSKPSFWLSIACIVLAGTVIYYRWKDHGKGAV